MGPGRAATWQRAGIPGAALERLLGSAGAEGTTKQGCLAGPLHGMMKSPVPGCGYPGVWSGPSAAIAHRSKLDRKVPARRHCRATAKAAELEGFSEGVLALTPQSCRILRPARSPAEGDSLAPPALVHLWVYGGASLGTSVPSWETRMGFFRSVFLLLRAPRILSWIHRGCRGRSGGEGQKSTLSSERGVAWIHC